MDEDWFHQQRKIERLIGCHLAKQIGDAGSAFLWEGIDEFELGGSIIV